ncbi:MAG: DHH family phosphoesterase [Elusimicrobia bacterium]|nr:DHH family phosphoesterase [Elusimicrobiota bacterium]
MTTPSWIEKLKKNSWILIIHHWDADGISSAALLTRYLEKHAGGLKIEYVVPEIGTYHLHPLKLGKDGNLDIPDRRYTLAFVVDYSVPEDDIVRLHEFLGIPLVIYDHHLRKPVNKEDIYYYNPVSSGDPGFDWPSCTWVLKKYLDLKISDFVVFGVAGDYEERFLPEGFEKFPEIDEYLKKTGMDYTFYVMTKDLIDIHYKENDMEKLKKLARILLDMEGDPRKIASMDEWAQKQFLHDKEIKDMLETEPAHRVADKLEIYIINSRRNIISTLTRRLAARTDVNYVMVVNMGFFSDRAQIYVRRSNRSDLNTKQFKKIAGEFGAQVGGKEDVAGIIMDTAHVDGYIERLREYYG